MTEDKKWYTINEASEYLGVSRRTIYKMIKDRRLNTYLLSEKRTRRILKADLDKAPRLLQEKKAISSLTAFNDPILADLWDNEWDAAYDDL